ncbi:nonribosomal peptide synthetase protein BlmIII [Lentzea xinjiangensis]|uniref:Nonribosomal peptide synthetase protein BlmIII n=1 Tax=Lentzea xinjiangensis TaxID=402600 RepID=A0A1H9VZ57_9PSEU|nr:AMP-binding protein [Lentzea xinjiangensis]SES27030.1 nonribosomal peptide synthetase protein BlmIII [Lentzea xinjiangensis]
MSMADQGLSLLPVEQRELLRGMNELTGDIPQGTVADAVAALAAGQGTGIAALEPARELTRTELLAAADRLAAALLDRQVAVGERVALCVEPGIDQVVGLLGVFRAGALALLVDPAAGHAARWEMTDQADVSVVVTQTRLLDRLRWPEGLGVLAVDDVPEARTPFAPPDRTDGHDAACVAGEAGTVLRHRDLLNLAADLADRFAVGPADRMTALTPVTSGRGVQETALGLLTGAALVFGEDVDLRDPTSWPDLVTRQRVTVWHSTPTVLDLLVTELERRGEGLPDHLRLVLLSGERLPTALVRRLRDVAHAEITVANLSAAEPHGPWVACHELTGEPPETPTVPIGRPMRNQRLHVLAENGSVCPAWVTGLVHCGGLVAEPLDGGDDSGVTHPETGERLLRTARYGRVLPDGVVEVVGDESAQLLVHGRRLHVHDTEVALAALPEALAAAVVTTGEGTESLGFVRLRPGVSTTEVELLGQLRRKVSPYLLPGRIDVVDRFPLTPDGCVDRQALAAVHSQAAAAPETAKTTPASGTDAGLLAAATAIACRVLGVSDIEPDMNLLDLGATSVELVRLATLAEDELGIEVAVEDLLRFPSIAVLIGPHLARSTGSGQPEQAPPSSSATAGDLLIGLVERQVFKDKRTGVRHEHDRTAGISLGGSADARVRTRRSERHFSSAPVVFADLAALLGALRTTDLGGETKYWYPSAGGAYPLGAYLDVAPGRVRDLDAGTYYVHPDRAELVPVSPGIGIPAAAHADINRAVLEESAFAIYLISRMDAITPLYGELAWEFSVFEAGAMTQLLMSVAAEVGLGLCPVGTLNPAELDGPLRLHPDDRFAHALLGGMPVRQGDRNGTRRIPDPGDRLGPASGGQR